MLSTSAANSILVWRLWWRTSRTSVWGQWTTNLFRCGKWIVSRAVGSNAFGRTWRWSAGITNNSKIQHDSCRCTICHGALTKASSRLGKLLQSITSTNYGPQLFMKQTYRSMLCDIPHSVVPFIWPEKHARRRTIHHLTMQILQYVQSYWHKGPTI